MTSLAIMYNSLTLTQFLFPGFVVLMGTDTMAYAASAVSFMFQNLGKPVIFTVRQAKVGLAQVFCSTFMIGLQHKPLSSNLF